MRTRVWFQKNQVNAFLTRYAQKVLRVGKTFLPSLDICFTGHGRVQSVFPRSKCPPKTYAPLEIILKGITGFVSRDMGDICEHESYEHQVKIMVSHQQMNGNAMVALQIELYHAMPPLPRLNNTFITMGTDGIVNQMELCRTAYRNYVDQREEGIPKIPAKTPDDIWGEHMKDLNQFKVRNGHCRVPRHYNDNPKLGRWVMNVRSHFQFIQKGKKSSLITEERLQQLQDIDFDFAPKNKSHTKYYVDRWVHHLQELYQFKQKNGHCRVPQRYKPNKKLGGWVLYVRHQYRKHQNGQPSTMTPDRIDQLKQLGFDFEPRKGRPGRSDSHSS